MAACPPGYIFNPHTYRCVSATGRVAKRLTRKEPTIRPTRRDVLRLEPVIGNDDTDGDGIPLLSRDNKLLGRLTRLPSDAPQILPRKSSCPAGQVRNPETGKCIKEEGRLHKYLLKTQTMKATRRTELPIPARYREEDAANEEPVLGGKIGKTNKAERIPLGKNRDEMKRWITKHCSNMEEPFTGLALRGLPNEEMTTVIKTSAGTCLRADVLDAHVRHERQKGYNAKDPLDYRKMLTLSNMDILGRQIREYRPDYRVPQKSRKLEPPTRRTPHPRIYEAPVPPPQEPKTSKPSSWTFFIGKDARSGDDFYSIYFYDKSKVMRNADGIMIPHTAIKADIGIIPAYVAPIDGSPDCSTAALFSAFRILDKKGRLLKEHDGRMIPALQLPTERAQWKTPDGAIQRTFFKQLCSYVQKLASA